MPRNFPDWRRGDPADAERLTRQHKARNQGITGGRGIDVVRGHDGIVIQLKETRIIPSPCCDALGACCVADGACVENTAESVCIQEGGDWAGPGTDCDPNPCRGACCQGANGETCVPDRTRAECEEGGGTFQGPGIGCTPNPCDSTAGACCYGQTCVPGQTRAVCENQNGSWQGAGTDCEPDPCISQPKPGGACCVGETCHPNQTEQSCCLLGGDWQGPNVPCDPDPCSDQTEGSCCTGPGHNTCVPGVTKGQCCVFNGGTGHWNGPGSTCGPPDPCTMPPPVGACCFGPPPPPAQSCVPNQTQLECQGEGGTWYPGQPCTPPQCEGEPPTVGACCDPGPLPQACHADWTAIQCAVIDGSWFADQPCTPAECLGEPPTMGACCKGPAPPPDQTCAETTLADCQAQGGNWHGGEPCNPLPEDCTGEPVTIGACCVNGAGGLCLDGLTNAQCTKQCPSCTWFAGQLCTPAECLIDPNTTGACCEVGAGGPCLAGLTNAQCDKQCPQCNWFPGQPCTPAECLIDPETTGACCELGAGGPCLAGLTSEECTKQCPQCAWFAGAPCTPAECLDVPPIMGACCPSPGNTPCIITTAEMCDGDYLGDGTNCGPPDPCIDIEQPMGACCCGEICLTLNEMDCLSMLSCEWTREGQIGGSCVPNNPCTVLGACCVPGGSGPTPGPSPTGCVDAIRKKTCTEGLGGNFMGNGSTCVGVCDCEGACCIGDQGSCIDNQTQEACAGEGGVFQGVCSTCGAVDCDIEEPKLGACCCNEVVCVQTTEESCASKAKGSACGGFVGEWKGFVPCGEDLCEGVPPLIDCCLPSPSCECVAAILVESCQALGGTVKPIGTCTGGGCCGACCNALDKFCVNGIQQEECNFDAGTWLGPGTSCGGNTFCQCCCIESVCVFGLGVVACFEAGGTPIQPCPGWPPGCGNGGPCV